MTRARTAWEAKLRPDLEPRVVRDPRMSDRLLIATPMLLAEEIARVPRGSVITFGELRGRLAKRFKADRSCPLTTGIFAAILAGVVSDDLAHHRKSRWPIWRLVRDDGTLSKNWELASRYRATLLREEGLRVTRAGETWRVIAPAIEPESGS
jgi:alkylated DNA nucleotide flippase Atl1